MELCVLASGSSGNCSVIRTPSGVLLIDAGIEPRTAGRRMEGTGVTLDDISAVCLTHLDRDHFRAAWARLLSARGVAIYCHADRLAECVEAVRQDCGADDGPAEEICRTFCPFDDRPFEAMPGVVVTPVALPHDRDGSHGFVVEGFSTRIGFATDFGRVPKSLYDCFTSLDLLAIESNYDVQMQLESTRPGFLKERVMGGWGHLSNEQAFEAARTILDRAACQGTRAPGHIVLLHRSRQCNCARRVRQTFSRDDRMLSRLVLAEQFVRSEWLRPTSLGPARGEQLVFAF